MSDHSDSSDDHRQHTRTRRAPEAEEEKGDNNNANDDGDDDDDDEDNDTDNNNDDEEGNVNDDEDNDTDDDDDDTMADPDYVPPSNPEPILYDSEPESPPPPARIVPSLKRKRAAPPSSPPFLPSADGTMGRGTTSSRKRPNPHQQIAKAATSKIYSQPDQRPGFMREHLQQHPEITAIIPQRRERRNVELDDNDDDDGEKERDGASDEKSDDAMDDDDNSDQDDDDECDPNSDNLFRRHPLDNETTYTLDLIEELADSAVVEWIPPTQLHANPRKLYLWSLRRFGYENMRAVYDIDDLSTRAGRTISRVIRLFKISCDHRYVEPAADDTPQLRQRRDHLNHSFDMLVSMISSAFDTVVAFAKMGELLKVGPPSRGGKSLRQQAANKCAAKLFRFRLMNLETLAGLESQQKLLIKCLNALEENNYRRYKERQIWKPHYVTIRGRQVNSHAWVYHTTIGEFVEKLISKDESPENFIEATSKSLTVEWVIRRLTVMYDSQFPSLILDRHCWAFRNGLFWGFDPSTCLPRFWPFDRPKKNTKNKNEKDDEEDEEKHAIPNDLFASQFIDAHFNVDWLRNLPGKEIFERLLADDDASNLTSTAGLAAHRDRMAPHPIENDDDDDGPATVSTSTPPPPPTKSNSSEPVTAEDRQRAFQGEKDGRFYTGHPQAEKLRQIAMEWLSEAYERILNSKAVKTFEEIIDYQAMGEVNTSLQPEFKDLGISPVPLHSAIGHKIMLANRTERKQVKMVVIAFVLGRMQYDLGEYGENGQFAFLIRGMAGTGKSTIGLIVSMMYPPDKVGVLMPRTETQFGMAPLFGRWIILCPELSKKMNISPEEFKSIVAGENVHFARKHIDPIEGMWRTPILLFGNVLPDWQEAEGSLARRFVMAEFTNKVKKTDCTLPLRLREELPALIAIGNIAFLLMRHLMQKRDVWSCPSWLIPQYFHRTRARLRSRLDTMLSFMFDRNWIIQEKTRYIHFKDLAADYAQWCHSTGLTKVSFTADNYEPLLQELGLRDFECSLPWNNKPNVSGRYVFGIGRAAGGDVPLQETVADLILCGTTPVQAMETFNGTPYTEVSEQIPTLAVGSKKPRAPGQAGRHMGKATSSR